MSASVVPPPILSEDAFRRLLVERVDERCLSVGMVVGLTEANRHRIVAHGCRDRSGAGPVNEKTLFEIGSITKLFTALLLSDMANRGEVSMDEPVAELLPRGTRVPFRDSKAITLLHDTPLPSQPVERQSDLRCLARAHVRGHAPGWGAGGVMSLMDQSRHLTARRELLLLSDQRTSPTGCVSPKSANWRHPVAHPTSSTATPRVVMGGLSRPSGSVIESSAAPLWGDVRCGPFHAYPPPT
jgi:hypothetical protein